MRLPSWSGPGGGGRRVQQVQQRERLTGLGLREQDPGQDQISRLPGEMGLVIGAQASLFRPAGGFGRLTLGQQQPRPLGRDGVDESGRARRGLPASPLPPPARRPDRRAAGRIPCERSQAAGQRRPVGQLAAERHALGDLAQREVEFVALIGHIG